MFRGQKKVGIVSTLDDVVLSVDSEYVFQKVVSGRLFLEIDLKSVENLGDNSQISKGNR